MDYVCDTNVWYDIAAGRLDPAKLKDGGNRLLAPAINGLEISSNLSANTFKDRKAASQAVIDHADDYLEDPERTMGTIWGLNLPPLGFDWRNVYRTIAASNDLAEIVNGTQNIMKVNAVAAQAWRKGFTDKFVADVETAIRKYAPNYALNRFQGKQRGHSTLICQWVRLRFHHAKNIARVTGWICLPCPQSRKWSSRCFP